MHRHHQCMFWGAFGNPIRSKISYPRVFGQGIVDNAYTGMFALGLDIKLSSYCVQPYKCCGLLNSAIYRYNLSVTCIMQVTDKLLFK